MTEGKTHRSSTARRRQDRWIAGLNQIKEQLLVPGDINNKIKLVTDGVVEHFEADFCRIWIIDEGDRCDLGCVHAEVTEGPRVCRYRDQCLHLVASSGCPSAVIRLAGWHRGKMENSSPIMPLWIPGFMTMNGQDL